MLALSTEDKSLMNIRNRNGPKLEPCGSLETSMNSEDLQSSYSTSRLNTMDRLVINPCCVSEIEYLTDLEITSYKVISQSFPKLHDITIDQ